MAKRFKNRGRGHRTFAQSDYYFALQGLEMEKRLMRAMAFFRSKWPWWLESFERPTERVMEVIGVDFIGGIAGGIKVYLNVKMSAVTVERGSYDLIPYLLVQPRDSYREIFERCISLLTEKRNVALDNLPMVSKSLTVDHLGVTA